LTFQVGHVAKLCLNLVIEFIESRIIDPVGQILYECRIISGSVRVKVQLSYGLIPVEQGPNAIG
jgi:hypothetical protein